MNTIEQNTALARAISLIASAWLVISAFVWRHDAAQGTNTWIVGLLCFVVALAEGRQPRLRYLNVVLSIWLFLSAFAFPAIGADTVWNNVIVAIVIFVASLVSWTPGRFVGPRPTGT